MFTNAWVATYTFLAAAMNDLIGYDPSSGMSGILRNVYLGLCQVPTAPFAPNSTIASLTEATYDGYARQEISWFPTDVSNLGMQEIIAANLQFRPTDSTVANTINGIFIATALTGGNLLMGTILARNVALTGPTTSLTVAPVFQLPTAGPFGGALVWA